MVQRKIHILNIKLLSFNMLKGTVWPFNWRQKYLHWWVWRLWISVGLSDSSSSSSASHFSVKFSSTLLAILKKKETLVCSGGKDKGRERGGGFWQAPITLRVELQENSYNDKSAKAFSAFSIYIRRTPLLMSGTPPLPYKDTLLRRQAHDKVLTKSPSCHESKCGKHFSVHAAQKSDTCREEIQALITNCWRETLTRPRHIKVLFQKNNTQYFIECFYFLFFAFWDTLKKRQFAETKCVSTFPNFTIIIIINDIISKHVVTGT